MFEVHGWATIRSSTCEIDEAADSKVVEQLRLVIEEVQIHHLVTVQLEGLNGLYCLTVSGMRNHRYEPVIDLFRWIAEHGKGSYGLLYIWDGEDSKRGSDYENDFRVWRLARGTLVELADPFLSPPIPTIEDPYDLPTDMT